MLRCVEQSYCAAGRHITKSLKTFFVFCSVLTGSVVDTRILAGRLTKRRLINALRRANRCRGSTWRVDWALQIAM